MEPTPFTCRAALLVNGDRVERLLEPRTTLLELLRDDLGLTGAKHGCGHGNCGACTVLVDGVAQYACLRLAVDCRDAVVITVEGLAAHGALHPVQQAFIDADALQCGYCTPGQVMSAVSLLEANPSPDAAAVELAMAGNLCRCGAYPNIRRAVLCAACGNAGGNGGRHDAHPDPA